MNKVCILLSSYNGEKFIKEQIDSILNQDGVEIELVIRDDGSTDNTKAIIREYGDAIHLIEGTNNGCEQSFAELLKYSSDADYYAFSDQDDYWLSDKVISEVRAIEGYDGPALAACNLYLCDDKLNITSVLHSRKAIRKIQYMMKNNYLCNMHGCVLLWNKDLHKMLSSSVPDTIISHDGWVNTIANSIGTTVILESPLIKYRIHGNNVAGHANTLLDRARKGFRIYLGEKHPRRDVIAQEALKRFSCYMDRNTNGYKTLLSIANYKESLKTKISLIQKDIIRKSPFPDKALWILCVLTNRY